jgi:hypothetical protein
VLAFAFGVYDGIGLRLPCRGAWPFGIVEAVWSIVPSLRGSAGGILPRSERQWLKTEHKHFLQMIRRSQRGRLKVYLGYGPGVGKTYQMLQEAHRLKRKASTWWSAWLKRTGGRRRPSSWRDWKSFRAGVEYRGIVVEEMDVDAIIARRPQVVVVDELAHTNVPGSRNSKRYQDVQDILAAGIHVISALNMFSIWKACTTRSSSSSA